MPLMNVWSVTSVIAAATLFPFALEGPDLNLIHDMSYNDTWQNAVT
jgi:hypothetical protein